MKPILAIGKNLESIIIGCGGTLAKFSSDGQVIVTTVAQMSPSIDDPAPKEVVSKIGITKLIPEADNLIEIIEKSLPGTAIIPSEIEDREVYRRLNQLYVYSGKCSIDWVFSLRTSFERWVHG